ncbi:MAG TPA: DUF6458 family protein [Streptosporangiaceae bacterium]|nr:DUF6458 family protein [Streptosporangiaceae bacterium]
MRTATGLFLIALGAILAFAVQGHPSWLNIQVVGWVVMLTGVAGMAIPRRGYGWLRRRTVLRRGPGGRPVVDRVEEQRYPPYIMLNPGADGVAEEVPAGSPQVGADPPTVAGPLEDPDPDGPATDPGPDPERLAAERQAVVDRTEAEWAAAEEAAPPGAPVPAEEVVEQYVEE